jgi:glycosyltransferase involved in cell wall biosynthesis
MSYLAAYLAQADFLVSPRVKGKNTPMKIYSYLDSGKALLATNLPTHTQVLTEDVAMLAAPSPRDFSRGVLRLAEDRALRQKLGQAGKQLIAERHTYEAFRLSLDMLYDWLCAEITQEEGAHPIAKDTLTGPLHR